jgi:hypothetical protein
MTQYKQISSATSGTVTITDSGTDIQLIHTGALTATLTIAFPATPYDGQSVSIASANGITALTLTTGVGSIINTITTLAAGNAGYFMYDLANTKWYKI